MIDRKICIGFLSLHILKNRPCDRTKLESGLTLLPNIDTQAVMDPFRNSSGRAALNLPGSYGSTC